MMRKSVLLGLVLAVAAGAGAYFYMGKPDQGNAVVSTASAQESTTTSTSTAATQSTDSGAASVSSSVSLVPDMILGQADAPLTVTEYASFTCPHCARFHETVWADFKKNYIDTGKVKLVYREVYFDKYGLWAAMVARCGGPEKYFGISDILYHTQSDWLASNDDAGIAEALRKIGLSAGLTADQINACMNDNAKATAMVQAYQTNATNDNVQGTPTFLIGGESHSGEMSYADFAALLDAKLPK